MYDFEDIVSSAFLILLFVVVLIVVIVFSVKAANMNNSEVETAFVNRKWDFVKVFTSEAIYKVEVYCDITWKDEPKTIIKEFEVTRQQYEAISVDDPVEFDENNKPIFEIKEGE